MTAPVFVDTNILVYRHDSSDPIKQSRADEWLTSLARHRSARVSYQVLQELYATLTRKLQPAFERGEAQQIVRDLAVWHPVTIDLAIVEGAWVAQERFMLSWWDALIVAAAASCGCGALVTEDMQHGQSFDGVRVVNPFAAPERRPNEILEALEND